MSVLTGATAGYSASNWYVLNNAWNSANLTYGKDYQITTTYDPTDVVNGTTFTWNYPTLAGNTYSKILAYPDLIYGPAPQSGWQATDKGAVFPLNVSDIGTLKAYQDISYAGDTRGFNVSYDIWFTDTPNGGPSSITNEVMIWLHQGGIIPFGKLVGTYSDGTFSGKIYHAAAQNYTAIISDSDVTTGQIDLVDVIHKLESLGIVAPTEYLASVDFGAEVASGAGSLTVNNLQLEIDATSLTGGLVDTMVTGSGQIAMPILSTVTKTLGAADHNLTLGGTAAAAGTGNALANIITGNAAANILDGGAGNDTLRGGGGNDVLKGGTGDDIFIVEGNGDSVIEAAGGGNDTVLTNTSYTLTAGQEIETLRARYLYDTAGINLTGNEFANKILGNSGNNILDGGGGDDILDGGGGRDILRGGAGNDIFLVKSGDSVLEAVGGGNDTVRADVNFTLAPGQEIENLQARTPGGYAALTLTGNEFANRITGNARNNILDGGAGDDYLDGGAGADTMKGGTGDDIFVVDSWGDSVVEAVGGGNDTVLTDMSYALSTKQEIENLSARTATSTAALSLTGNALDNRITGNAGSNVLDGGAGNDYLDGSAGADVMKGGLGDDIFIVDNAGDRITELAGNGTDTVLTDIGYTLQTGASVEVLQARTPDTVTPLALTGNAFDNGITGNAGDNRLDGGAGNDTLSGGAGNDTLIGGTGDDLLNGGSGDDAMQGGAGDDIYYVDSRNDTVVEAVGGGSDTVFTGIGYSLKAAQEVESLLADDAAATTPLFFGGNEYNNRIVGNAGANSLFGSGGDDRLDGGAGNDLLSGGTGDDILTGSLGTDILTGGAGRDTFIFRPGDSGNAAATADTITDFRHNDGDLIDLSAFDADPSRPGTQPLHFAGDSADHTAGAVWLVQNGSTKYIDIDLNGDGGADFMIASTSGGALVAGDFIL